MSALMSGGPASVSNSNRKPSSGPAAEGITNVIPVKSLEGNSHLPQVGSPEYQQNCRASMADGAAFGVMVGLGETSLTPFALAAGHGDVFAGLVSSVPQLFGGLLQLLCPRGVRMLQSHARWVIGCVVLQTISFLPLALCAWFGNAPAPVILIAVSLYWAGGLGGNPAWNTWIGTLIPPGERAVFFARRSRVNQFANLLGFVASGLMLQLGQQSGMEMLTFAALFTLAMASRTVSIASLLKHSEPSPLPENMNLMPISTQWRRLTSGTTGRLLLFAVSMQCVVYVSAPYFVPYMRRILQHSYWEYTSILGVSYLAKYVSLPRWGRLAHRAGAFRLLTISSIGVIPLAVAWCVSSNYWWLIAIQIAAGALWGAYDLALFLIMYETLPEDERTSILTAYNLAQTGAAVCGSLLGGAVLKLLGVSAGAYLMVFALSSVGRFANLLLLRRFGEKRASANMTAAS